MIWMWFEGVDGFLTGGPFMAQYKDLRS